MCCKPSVGNDPMTRPQSIFSNWAARAALILAALILAFVLYPFARVRPFNERMILAAGIADPRARLAAYGALAGDERLRSVDRFDAAAAAARQAKELGDRPAARHWLEAALAQPVTNPDFRENVELEYADLLIALKEWDEARARLDSLIGRTPNPQRRRTAQGLLVAVLRQSGRVEEAARLLEELTGDPAVADRLSWRIQLIECWAELGRRDAALELLRETRADATANDAATRAALDAVCRRLDCPTAE